MPAAGNDEGLWRRSASHRQRPRGRGSIEGLGITDSGAWAVVSEPSPTTAALSTMWRTIDRLGFPLQETVVVAAIRLNGISAPAVFDGPIDNPTPLACVGQVLFPTLQPGDAVVLDTHVHKQPAVRVPSKPQEPRWDSFRDSIAFLQPASGEGLGRKPASTPMEWSRGRVLPPVPRRQL